MDDFSAAATSCVAIEENLQLMKRQKNVFVGSTTCFLLNMKSWDPVSNEGGAQRQLVLQGDYHRAVTWLVQTRKMQIVVYSFCSTSCMYLEPEDD